ncbi:hypothetical protein COV19_07605 [Candidatus Woesearchaeota archaeon CG10_big_fil_rev_8_21_14_0_10_44_13]|nr:MAG: hypothetical protein COV19_07605 [Candidatus Woesearchaeota archaeon CG10_big_fil_rev_8_21_14_0_10_44_13]
MGALFQARSAIENKKKWGVPNYKCYTVINLENFIYLIVYLYIMVGKSDFTLISFRGDRNIWQDFMHKVKKNKKQVWEVMEPLLKDYIQKEVKNGNKS